MENQETEWRRIKRDKYVGDYEERKSSYFSSTFLLSSSPPLFYSSFHLGVNINIIICFIHFRCWFSSLFLTFFSELVTPELRRLLIFVSKVMRRETITNTKARNGAKREKGEKMGEERKKKNQKKRNAKSFSPSSPSSVTKRTSLSHDEALFYRLVLTSEANLSHWTFSLYDFLVKLFWKTSLLPFLSLLPSIGRAKHI